MIRSSTNKVMAKSAISTKGIQIFDYRRNTLIDLLEYRACQTPNKIAYKYLKDGKNEEVTLTYAELSIKAKAIAAKLQQLNLAGERALLCYPPGLDFIEAFFGCLYAQVIAVPLYPPKINRSLERLLAIANNAEPKVILATKAGISIFFAKKNEVPELDHLLWLASDEIAVSAADLWQKKRVVNTAIAFLQYTSGSTSDPKGVITTHQSILYNQEMIKIAFQLDAKTIVVGWSPHFHDQGLIGNILQPLYLGGACVLLSPFHFIHKPFLWLKAISKYKATISGGPNFAYDLCVERITESDIATLNLNSWRIAYNGAEPIRFETLERFYNQFKNCGFKKENFYPVYGLAEAMVFSSTTRFLPDILTQYKIKHNSKNKSDEIIKKKHVLVGCGKPTMAQIIKIVDPKTCRELARNKIGEIWIHGTNVAKGYWRNPEATDLIFNAKIKNQKKQKYLRTGDLGFVREDNTLFICGRNKDLIIIRGQNLYPQDIELTVEKSHSAINKYGVAAFSVSSDRENLLVVISELKKFEARKVNSDEVFSSIISRLAEVYDIQVNTIVLIKPMTIPKTSSGKIQRQRCKNIFLNNGFDETSRYVFNETNKFDPKKSELNSVEQKIKIILSDILGLRDTSFIKNLKTIGLNSFLVSQLLFRIENEFNITMQLVEILNFTEISQLSNYIKNKVDQNKVKKILNAEQFHFTIKTTPTSAVQYENRPILPLIASGQIPAVQAAALAYWPDINEQNLLLDKLSEKIQDLPFVLNILETKIGRVAIIPLPIFASELYAKREKLLKMITDGLLFAKFIGAQTVSLAGVLPSAINYGQAIRYEASDKYPKITTGHATTVAAIILQIEKALTLIKRDIQSETIGFLGLGSIGKSALQLMLTVLPHPKAIILCDIAAEKYLEGIKRQIVNEYGFKGTISILSGQSKPDKKFYQSTLIIGATNQANVLQVTMLQKECIVIDDSAPHCFDTKEAFRRLKEKQDIVITEGGVLKAPYQITELRCKDFFNDSLVDYIPGIFFRRNPYEITSCVFSSILTNHYNEINPTIGFVDVHDSKKHYKLLKELNFCGNDINLEGQLFSVHLGELNCLPLSIL